MKYNLMFVVNTEDSGIQIYGDFDNDVALMEFFDSYLRNSNIAFVLDTTLVMQTPGTYSVIYGKDQGKYSSFTAY